MTSAWNNESTIMHTTTTLIACNQLTVLFYLYMGATMHPHLTIKEQSVKMAL